MLNLLKDYIPNSIAPHETFSTNPNLRKKADENGILLPYYGNTVIWALEDSFITKLKELQSELYLAAPQMLSEPLEPASFHMTLHDLVNSDTPDDHFWDHAGEILNRTMPILKSWSDWPDIPMRTTWIFNMVNTSLVLGLEPIDADGWAQLSEMYRTLEEIVPLGYKWTPHITLAYFRPGTYSSEEAAKLRSALKPVDLTTTLRMKNLRLDIFTSMKDYSSLCSIHTVISAPITEGKSIPGIFYERN